MDRRGFLGGILAAAVAPAIVKAGVLMPVRSIIVPGYISIDEYFKLMSDHYRYMEGHSIDALVYALCPAEHVRWRKFRPYQSLEDEKNMRARVTMENMAITPNTAAKFRAIREQVTKTGLAAFTYGLHPK